jgi:hypothetical protein
MKLIILILSLMYVVGCTSAKIIRDENLIGLWSYAHDDGVATYFEFRNDKSGTYGVGKSFQECDCGHEFSWSKIGNVVSAVGFDGFEIDGEYQEVTIIIKLAGIHKKDRLVHLRPKNNNYRLIK